jgi:glycosyltransferase involved in cell wall biosynthesis
MLTLAIGLAAAGACCFAGTVHLQHRAVHRATTGREGRALGLPAVRTILRSPGWYAGIGLAGLGAVLHVLALTMAPLAVVQPIGVLTLVLTVLLARTVLTRAVLAALVMSVTGVAGFVALSAVTTSTALPAPDLASAQWAVLGAAGLAVAARHARDRARCLLLALATAVLFGFTSALVRAAAVAPLDSGLAALVVTEAVAAVLAGVWLLHQAYASGPAAVVAGATTIVDPLSAVLIGVFAYGEMTPGQLAGMVVPGVVAVAGLVLLAREVPATTAPARRKRREGPLRIALTADTYPPDVNGAANFAYRLASGLAARGHEVHVICPSTNGETFTSVHDGVTVHRIGSLRTPFHPTFRFCPPWRTARTVPALLAEIEPDVVHTQAHFLIGRSAVRAATAAGIPVVATNHFMPENLLSYGPLPRWTHRSLARLAWRDLVRVFGRATVCTTPTPRAAELLERNGLNRPVMAISCGIDRAHYAGPPEPTGAPTILFVGRLDAEKNVHELLEAAAALPDVHVEVVGDGSERHRLAALAARLGIAGRVRFHGFVPDEELVRAYRRCDVFCMPGTAELQSLVTMEAMAAGKPVVAADAMALPHLVRPGHNGWLYPPGDVTELAGRLAAVLADEQTRTAMGKASLDLIAAHDLGSTLDQFERVYLDIAAHPAAFALQS